MSSIVSLDDEDSKTDSTSSEGRVSAANRSSHWEIDHGQVKSTCRLRCAGLYSIGLAGVRSGLEAEPWPQGGIGRKSGASKRGGV